MNILKVEVKGLFGELTHTVPLTDEGITFIHGPNGCGKTTFLSLLYSFFERNFGLLINTPFDRMTVFFDNEETIEVSRTKVRASEMTLFDAEDNIVDSFDLKVALKVNGAETEKFSYRDHLKELTKKRLPISPMMVERKVPGLRRVAPSIWQDVTSRRRFTWPEVIERYGDLLDIPTRHRAPQWLSDRLAQCRMGFVRAQRLVNAAQPKSYRQENESPVEAIEDWSERIKALISNQLADSAIKAQALDRTFPARLMGIKKSGLHSNEQVIKELYKDTEQTSQNLMSAGLLEKAESVPLPDGRLSPTERRVLSLYLHDLKTKLASYEGLQGRIQALLDIVGGKLRRKSLSIDRSSGLSVQSKVGACEPLKLSMLSSGEKNQIILFCELIFSSSHNDLYLIDEPEISLHVEWQRHFLKDLEKVRALTGAKFVVATHSPQIINNRRDLAVALDGGAVE